MVQKSQRKSEGEAHPNERGSGVWTEVDHTIRIARLKLLFVPARITQSHRQAVVKYSTHDARVAGLLDFMEYLDRQREKTELGPGGTDKSRENNSLAIMQNNCCTKKAKTIKT